MRTAHRPTIEQRELKSQIEKICERFDAAYWARADENGEFPEEFVGAIAEGGWLGVAMPQDFGGAGLGLTEAAIVMQTVTESGAGFTGASAFHINIFGPNPIVKFGTPDQRRRFLPPLIAGTDKCCFGVTEPDSGLDTASLKTKAEKVPGGYLISGRKIWTTGVQRANKIMIVARTTPRDRCRKATDGLSLFYAGFDRAKIQATPIPKMGRKAVESNVVFIDGLFVPDEDLIGEEGRGFPTCFMA